MQRLMVAVLLALALAGCGSGGQAITGVVVEVDGDITTVDSFVVVDESGRRAVFTPSASMTFHGGAPIGHLQDHLRSGERVRVVFESTADGRLIAISVSDA